MTATATYRHTGGGRGARLFAHEFGRLGLALALALDLGVAELLELEAGLAPGGVAGGVVPVEHQALVLDGLPVLKVVDERLGLARVGHDLRAQGPEHGRVGTLLVLVGGAWRNEQRAAVRQRARRRAESRADTRANGRAGSTNSVGQCPSIRTEDQTMDAKAQLFLASGEGPVA